MAWRSTEPISGWRTPAATRSASYRALSTKRRKAMQKTRVQLGLLIAMTAGTAFSQPVISSATSNFAVNPPTLTINGKNFGALLPTVTLGGAPLTVQSFTPSVAVATLPPGANQGSYRLVLVNNQGQSATFDVTLGAAGPAGPTGPVG